MTRTILALLVVASALVAQTKPPPKDITEDFDVPEGMHVTLWAESPQLFNPTAMDVDDCGRIWVTEAVNYRKWGKRNPGRFHAKGDRVMILEDTDGDGRCDTSKVFVQEKELVSPLGIFIAGKDVYVSCSPHIIKYTDDDGDDIPDRREVFLTGFGGHDHDHGVHSIVAGPAGDFYLAVGNAGPHVVKDRSGWMLRSGSLYSGGGAKSVRNRSGMISDDGRVWTGGLVLRLGEDGKNLTVMAHNFRNNYEVAVDAFGDMWQSDNDDDGNRSCRTSWVMEGGNYGYFSPDGARSWRIDRRPGQDTQTAHWHGDDPGVCPAGCINGAGGPTGVDIYERGLLPARFIGAVLNADAGRNVVYAHHPKPDGAGLRPEADFVIKAKLGRNAKQDQRWFRPSDVMVGPDGSIYVADWYDPGVGGHAARDREAYGRIVRIAPGDVSQRPFSMPTGVSGVVSALVNPSSSVRWRALARARALEASDQARLGAMLQLERLEPRAEGPGIPGEPPASPRYGSARLAWAEAAVFGPEGVLVAGHPLSRDAAGRVLQLRIARAFGAKQLLPLLQRLAKDAAARVRREVAVALRDADPAVRLPLLEEIARRHPAGDRWSLEGIGVGADKIEAELYQRLVKGHDDPTLWSDALAEVVWRLHPTESASALASRAMAKSLTTEQRRAAADALAFIKDRTAAEAMLNVAMAGPTDVQPTARWWVQNRDKNDWRAYRLARELGVRGMDGAELKWSSGIMKKGTKEIDIDVTGLEAMWLVVSEGKNGFSYDWAAWIDPRLEGPAGALHLSKQPWDSAKQGWGSTHVGRNCSGGPLKIGGVEYATGIGTHAPARTAWRIPSGGYTRFKAIVGPDDGGTTQGGSSTELEFQVWVLAPPDRSWITDLKKTILDSDQPEPKRVAATKRLATDPGGGHVLVDLVMRGKLPVAMREAAAEGLFRNPDLTVRALASAHFPRTNAAGVKLPPIADLVKIPGDARRGKDVFFGKTSQCAKCHSYANRGGHTGPDLTKIRDKFGPEAIFDAILNPSAAITFGYDSWIIVTTDDDLYSGFILADGDIVVVKDSEGRRHAIPREKINYRRKEKTSVMPDNVALGMKPQELADLVAFLSDHPSTAVKDPTISLFNGKDLTGWTFHLNRADTKATDVWTIKDGILDCAGNPIGYLRTEKDYTNFVLELDWRFRPGGRPGNSGVLLRMTGMDKVWPKSIEAQLQHRNAGDIWNIDAFDMEVDESRTSGRRTRKLLPTNEKPLGEWNHYKITLLGGNLTLEVNGRIQNVASWCVEVPGKICLQSEGAPVQFRDIRLTPLRR
ncbi:MAG: hypothetical protein CMJ83_21650 [Planctomycetes bacterium]|nr:hypothetical protein [Planctomycetota bacterium]